MKKLSFLLVFVISFSLLHAQKKGTDWVKLGLHTGIPVSDAGDAASFALGVDAKYQFINLKSFGVGFATGYTHYFGKEDFKDFGVIPVAVLLRYYPTKHFFVGSDLGYGFITGDVGETDANGNFYLRPEIGYHNDKWNIYALYQDVLEKDANVGMLGVGVIYNIIRP